MPHKEGSEITNHFKIVSPLNKNINENFTLIGSPSDINYLENEYKVLKIIHLIRNLQKESLMFTRLCLNKFLVFYIVFVINTSYANNFSAEYKVSTTGIKIGNF